MTDAANDNPSPHVRLVPLIGEIHDDGTFVRYARPELIPLPVAALGRPLWPSDPREA
jgi:hypothetical protein